MDALRDDEVEPRPLRCRSWNVRGQALTIRPRPHQAKLGNVRAGRPARSRMHLSRRSRILQSGASPPAGWRPGAEFTLSTLSQNQSLAYASGSLPRLEEAQPTYYGLTLAAWIKVGAVAL